MSSKTENRRGAEVVCTGLEGQLPHQRLEAVEQALDRAEARGCRNGREAERKLWKEAFKRELPKIIDKARYGELCPFLNMINETLEKERSKKEGKP